MVVIGASFCGLSVAAALRHYGVGSFAVLEAGDRPGWFFSGHYDRVKLHTPHHRLPKDGQIEQDGNYPMYKTKEDVVDYFRRYMSLHNLGEHIRFSAEVSSFARAGLDSGSGWSCTMADGSTITAKVLVVCTGAAHEPHVLALPGRETFEAAGGTVLHSREYTNGTDMRGRRVLVVGTGNSAAEICVDLVESGARTPVCLLAGRPRRFYSMEQLSWLHWYGR